jgi:uncharacterized protein YndB with AHSA1/START domain
MGLVLEGVEPMTDVQSTLRLTRVLDVPREDVWEAWTDPEMLARWWWPARFRTAHEIDLAVGSRYTFRSADLPDIGVLALTGTYLEVRRPERLVYTWQWEGQDEWPTQVTVELLERGGKTEVHIVHQGFATTQERENHVVGWTDCLDRLHILLTPDRAV